MNKLKKTSNILMIGRNMLLQNVEKFSEILIASIYLIINLNMRIFYKIYFQKNHFSYRYGHYLMTRGIYVKNAQIQLLKEDF